jgi:predicted amidohydrolase YtcJ
MRTEKLRLFAVLLWWLTSAGAQTQPPADLVLVNGKVITMDAKDSVVEAVAVRSSKIIAVGTTAEIRKLAGLSTRSVDLHGRSVTPGLIDAHLHFADVSPLYSIDLSNVTSIADVQRLVRERVSKARPGEWIEGRGWDEGKLAERRYIRADDLDAVAPANPVWLSHTTGHYGVANSAALQLAKITAETKDPHAGTIDRNAAGAPTGVLKEAAMELVHTLVPAYTTEQMRDGYVRMMQQLNREGMTAIKDPGIREENWQIYSQLAKDNKLTIHLFTLWYGGTSLESLRPVLERLQQLPRPRTAGSNGDLLIAGGIKLFMDGSGGARTAWMYDDWNKNQNGIDAGNKGYPAIEPQTYREMIRAIHDAGIHVSTHAVGDRAIDWVVNTYADALKAKPTLDLRHGIIHANLPSDHAIATMAQLEKQYAAAYPEAQAEFMWWIGDNYAGNLGEKRSQRLIPLQTYLKQGILWAGGSDYSVTPYPARYGIWASVARQTLKGTYASQPFGTAEAVDIHAALRSYTIWAAHQLFLEDKIGSIEVGKNADLAVWDRDWYTVPTDAVKDMKCEMTIFAGKVIWTKD